MAQLCYSATKGDIITITKAIYWMVRRTGSSTTCGLFFMIEKMIIANKITYNQIDIRKGDLSKLTKAK